MKEILMVCFAGKNWWVRLDEHTFSMKQIFEYFSWSADRFRVINGYRGRKIAGDYETNIGFVPNDLQALKICLKSRKKVKMNYSFLITSLKILFVYATIILVS